jgi:hypothetical protein
LVRVDVQRALPGLNCSLKVTVLALIRIEPRAPGDAESKMKGAALRMGFDESLQSRNSVSVLRRLLKVNQVAHALDSRDVRLLGGRIGWGGRGRVLHRPQGRVQIILRVPQNGSHNAPLVEEENDRNGGYFQEIQRINEHRPFELSPLGIESGAVGVLFLNNADELDPSGLAQRSRFFMPDRHVLAAACSP